MIHLYDDIFYKNGFDFGRLIHGSKSTYKRLYPNNKVYFNANIFTLEDGKIWYGDLDLTLEKEKLQIIAKEINKKLYVLYEMDGRFEHETPNNKWIKEKAICII